MAPFGLVAGVAMVAGGIPPEAAMAMSLVVYAGASMLAATQLLADNAYALSIARFTEHPQMAGKLGYFLSAALPVWITWQVAVGLGILVGAGLPAQWRLEFAAPLAFIALTVPLLRDRAMVAAALAAAVTVVALWALPMRLSLAAAAVVGIVVGMLVRRSA